jgi:hypothetical protein
MHRLAPVLLLGGVLLFANGVHAPASPAPAVDGSAGVTASVGQASAVMGEVSAELDRLKARVSPPPAAPVPQRDPFRFGRRVEPAIAAPVDVAPPPEPVVELPRLVAVVETPGDGGTVTRSASIAAAGVVSIVKVGETTGRFVVESIDAGGVLLRDRFTSTVHRLSLR